MADAALLPLKSGNATDDILYNQHVLDRDILLTAIALHIQERRVLGYETNVFPGALYLNTRVWEDDIAPMCAADLAQMNIKVLTSPEIEPDVFHLTQTVQPIREIVNYTKTYGALPEGKDI